MDGTDVQRGTYGLVGEKAVDDELAPVSIGEGS